MRYVTNVLRINKEIVWSKHDPWYDAIAELEVQVPHRWRLFRCLTWNAHQFSGILISVLCIQTSSDVSVCFLCRSLLRHIAWVAYPGKTNARPQVALRSVCWRHNAMPTSTDMHCTQFSAHNFIQTLHSVMSCRVSGWKSLRHFSGWHR